MQLPFLTPETKTFVKKSLKSARIVTLSAGAALMALTGPGPAVA